MSPPIPFQAQGSLRIFGHEATRAQLSVLPRTVGWRSLRAGGFTAGGVALAPVVALIPPHAAWALASVLTGVVLGLRKWVERYTLVSLEGVCPRCGARICVEAPTRLRTPSTVDCVECHHGATLTVPEEALRPG